MPDHSFAREYSGTTLALPPPLCQRFGVSPEHLPTVQELQELQSEASEPILLTGDSVEDIAAPLSPQELESLSMAFAAIELQVDSAAPVHASRIALDQLVGASRLLALDSYTAVRDWHTSGSLGATAEQRAAAGERLRRRLSITRDYWTRAFDRALMIIPQAGPVTDDPGQPPPARWTVMVARDVLLLNRLSPGRFQADPLSAFSLPVSSMWNEVVSRLELQGLTAAAIALTGTLRYVEVGAAGSLVRGALEGLKGYKADEKPALSEPKVSWMEVQAQLLGKRDRREPYTSGRELAAELTCSEATIRKAIGKSPTLKGWMNRSRKAPESAPAISLPQSARVGVATEEAEHEVSQAEVDAIMARLIEDAQPPERRELEKMSPEQRFRIAAAFVQHGFEDEPSPLSSAGGNASRPVRQHKRA